jgi:hypothetical protein
MAELIACNATLLQRKIQMGTGPNFLERARISLDGFKPLGSAQNLFRRLEASWIRPKLFSPALRFLDPIQKAQDSRRVLRTRPKSLEPIQEVSDGPRASWPVQKDSGPNQDFSSRPRKIGAVRPNRDRTGADLRRYLLRRESNRIRHVDELGFQAKLLPQVLAQRPDAQALGRVVAGGEIVDLRLAGHVHHPFAHLAGDVGI